MPETDAVAMLQQLIQFDTTNPPGNERACIEYLGHQLRSAGLVTTLLAKDENRPNLVARLPGRGEAPPLLLFGHVDVVTTAHQSWSVPPFEGRIQDGFVWGRGALDMKSGLAMMTSALIRLAATGARPQGDILFAAVSDEEAGGRLGARFLVEEHAPMFDGVRYAIGEFGGFPLHVNDVPVYLIQVEEKRPCWIELRLTGPAGHGARPMRDGAMADLGHVLTRLNRGRLPVHITETTRQMIQGMAPALPPHKRVLFRQLLKPRLTDRVLGLLGETGRNLEPLFRNTVNATVVRGGDKPNVIPSEAVLGLDGRLLPGFTPDQLLEELAALLGKAYPFDILLYDESPVHHDPGLMSLLQSVLARAHPDSLQAPYLLPGSSDARFFARLGIQTYGFLPMNLPVGFNFFETIHAADERIPIESVAFGADVMLDLLTQYGQES